MAMAIYADTSFLVPVYSPEEDSLRVLRWFQKSRAGLPFTPLHRLELRTALRLRVFRGEITVDQRSEAFRELNSDLLDNILVHTPIVWTEAFRLSEELATSYVETLGVRSMDLLHVAIARSLKARDFLTLDSRQKELALAAGMKVKF